MSPERSNDRGGVSKPPSEGAKGAATRTQIRGSSVLVGGQAFALVVNLITQILIVQYLSKSGFGAFAYVLSVIAIAQAVAGFGLSRGISRFVPIYEERGELGKAAGTLAFAFGAVLAIGLAVVVVVIALRGAIAGSLDGEEAVSLLLIMIVIAPLQAFGTLLDGLFAVYSRPRVIAMRKFILAPLVRLIVVGALAISGSGVLLLAWGYVAAELIGLAAYAPMLVPMLRQHGILGNRERGQLTMPVREVMGFTTPLLTNDIAGAALNAAGAIALGALAGVQEVASFRAVFPIVLTMSYVLTSFGLLFVPLASRLYARDDAEELNRLFWQTSTWTTVLAYPIFITCVVLAEPLTVLLFGERYESSAPVLAVLALGMYVNAALGPNGVLLGVFGRVRFIVATNVAAVVVNVILMLVLVPAHDALGAAIATSVTYLMLNVVRQIGLARHTPIQSLDRDYTAAWVVVVAASAVALAIEQALSPAPVLEVGLAVAAFAAVVAATRRRMRLLDTFPELSRLPLLRRG